MARCRHSWWHDRRHGMICYGFEGVHSHTCIPQPRVLLYLHLSSGHKGIIIIHMSYKIYKDIRALSGKRIHTHSYAIIRAPLHNSQYNRDFFGPLQRDSPSLLYAYHLYPRNVVLVKAWMRVLLFHKKHLKRQREEERKKRTHIFWMHSFFYHHLCRAVSK